MAFRLMTGEIPHGWQCPDDWDLRAAFGCDAPCDGWWVEGLGDRIFYRCPITEMSEDLTETLTAWRALHLHKVWPVGGGQDNQSAWFFEAAALLDGERADYEEREMKKRSGRTRT